MNILPDQHFLSPNFLLPMGIILCHRPLRERKEKPLHPTSSHVGLAIKGMSVDVLYRLEPGILILSIRTKTVLAN